MIRFRHALSIVVLTFFIQGCVSKAAYKKLQDESLTTQTKLQDELDTEKQKKTEDELVINDLQQKLGKISTNKAEVDRSLAETRQALSELSVRKAEMENQLKEFKNLTVGLKSMIDTGSVKVQFVKGRMVVTMGSDVLFHSGSAHLSSEGEGAIKKVTQQIALISGKDFQVEGHTDNVPINTKEFPSNWELASARAVNVVNTMIDSGMSPERVSAASYADTRPETSNETPEGRTQNRRIDIVVIPDLSKLMNVTSAK
jgi:chemotaxis protein MotB